MVKLAAENARGQKNDKDALMTILNGFLLIKDPSHNSDQWVELKDLAIDHMFQDGSTIAFNGTDTRDRRTVNDPGRLPKELSNSFLLKRGGLPARYSDASSLKIAKRTHVEYFMRLNITDADGSAYFIITHSQDNGGYVALAKVEGKNVGKGASDYEITVAEPDFAGEVIWWDHLDKNHPCGCNHLGNGGQIGSITVLVGQDWTKSYPVYGHVVDPVGKGSKVLFYDFSSLKSARTPSMGSGSRTSDAYVGCLTTQELGLRPGDDGEVSSANIEQGADGMFYLIAGNANQSDPFGDGDRVSDNGSIYVGSTGGIALLGAYKSINDKKDPPTQRKSRAYK